VTNIVELGRTVAKKFGGFDGPTTIGCGRMMLDNGLARMSQHVRFCSFTYNGWRVQITWNFV